MIELHEEGLYWLSGKKMWGLVYIYTGTAYFPGTYEKVPLSYADRYTTHDISVNETVLTACKAYYA
jgi:hypothetical protein